jgi:hypothetical protein
MNSPLDSETPSNVAAKPIPGELDDQALEQVSGGLIQFQASLITRPTLISSATLLSSSLFGGIQEESAAHSTPSS